MVGLRRARAGADTARRLVERSEQAVLDAAGRVELLRHALDALPQGIVITDHRGEVVLRNAAAGSFLGVPHADALVDDAVGDVLGAALQGRRPPNLVNPEALP